MSENKIIKLIADYVKKTLSGESSGHDWWHIYRVRNNAKQIAQFESVDLLVVELAALLHDIFDWKFADGNVLVGSEMARKWLDSPNVKDSIVNHVCQIIETVSFKGAGVSSKMQSLEGRVVQDADRLDAIGAIGIARTFAYAGHTGGILYHPDLKPQKHETFEQYRNNNGSAINHFYEKLLLLRNLMNTNTAKKIADNRHEFMETYLQQFFLEWEGEDLASVGDNIPTVAAERSL